MNSIHQWELEKLSFPVVVTKAQADRRNTAWLLCWNPLHDRATTLRHALHHHPQTLSLPAQPWTTSLLLPLP